MSTITSELNLIVAIHLPPNNSAHFLLNLRTFLYLALTLLLATLARPLARRKKMNSDAQIVHFRAHYFPIRLATGPIIDLCS
jgi:hypothetical protein